MSAEPVKQYGLILPKKGLAQDIIQRPSIFDEGSDSGDSAGEGDWKKKAFQREATKSIEKRQTKVQIQKALKEDSSIFQYDEVYDEMKDKGKSDPKKEVKKSSRYIQSLKRNAERRKLENERRLERQVQKERQQEGEEFQDKETFVTSSYKKKLEEFLKMDEEEKRVDRLEEIGDVLKQKDISGFYRHLYKTTVGEEKPEEVKVESVIKEEEEKTEVIVKKSPIKEPSSLPDSSKKQKRQYRKRTKSRSSKEEGEKTTSTSSSSSSSSSSESENGENLKIKKREVVSRNTSREKTPDKKRSGSRGKENMETKPKPVAEEKKKKISEAHDSVKSETKREKQNDVKSVIDEHKPSVNVWSKRTVGTNFYDALKRYLERKSKRQGSY